MALATPPGSHHEQFTDLLDGILPNAYGVAMRLARNDADAEDLLQEASLRAFSAFDSFEKGTNFKAWYLRILTNCFNMRWRKQRREPDTVDIDQAPVIYMFRRSFVEGFLDAYADPATELLSRMDSDRVTEAVRSLAEEYRAVCVLYFLEDLTYPEIAGILDLPLGTVRSRLHRGRRILQRKLWRLAEADGVIAALRPGAGA